MNTNVITSNVLLMLHTEKAQPGLWWNYTTLMITFIMPNVVSLGFSVCSKTGSE